MEDPRNSKRLPDQTVNGLKLGYLSPRNIGNSNCKMGRRKCQSASSSPQQKNLRGIARLKAIADARPNWEKICSCCAVHWEGWQRSGSSSSCDFNWCQWGTVRFRKIQELAGKCRRKGMWEAFTLAWCTSQFPFKSLWRHQKPKPPSRKNGINQRQLQRGKSRKWDENQKSSVGRTRMEKQFTSRTRWNSFTWRTL